MRVEYRVTNTKEPETQGNITLYDAEAKGELATSPPNPGSHLRTSDAHRNAHDLRDRPRQRPSIAAPKTGTMSRLLGARTHTTAFTLEATHTLFLPLGSHLLIVVLLEKSNIECEGVDMKLTIP